MAKPLTGLGAKCAMEALFWSLKSQPLEFLPADLSTVALAKVEALSACGGFRNSCPPPLWRIAFLTLIFAFLNV